jgi:hypothetical protein
MLQDFKIYDLLMTNSWSNKLIKAITMQLHIFYALSYVLLGDT